MCLKSIVRWYRGQAYLVLIVGALFLVVASPLYFVIAEGEALKQSWCDKESMYFTSYMSLRIPIYRDEATLVENRIAPLTVPSVIASPDLSGRGNLVVKGKLPPFLNRLPAQEWICNVINDVPRE
jgi:hypothetical protein